MITCEYHGVPLTDPRSHPWTDAVSSSECRYYDLKATPSLIRTSLEDFVGWSHHAAIDDFYSLLEWLNASASALESNDCAFTGLEANDNPRIHAALQCSGRMMVLYRALARNLAEDQVEWLRNRLHHHLAPLDPELEWGVVGTTIVPVRYLTLPGGPEAQLGHQLMISFWAWGSSEAELMTNLGRVMKNLSRALRGVSAESATGGRG
jgi:hypothetical protein